MGENPERIWACMQGPMVGLFVSGGPTAGWPEYVRADRIEAQAAEIERLREALKGPFAWLERWAVHVGSCENKPECRCGLLFAQHELRSALETKP